MQFKYADNYSSPVSPDVAGRELERIRKKRGELKTAEVVEEARPKDAPLHPVFEWRDDVAAEEYRKQQARQLIRGIKVVYDNSGKPSESRMYVNIRQEERQHYVPAVEAMSDNDMREHVLSRLSATIMHYNSEMQNLRGLAKVKAKMRELISEIEDAA